MTLKEIEDAEKDLQSMQTHNKDGLWVPGKFNAERLVEILLKVLEDIKRTKPRFPF